jgi:hypothetical protein
MNFKDVLAQLREERDRLNAAISNLERLAYGHLRGPGRPPSFVTKSHTNNINHSMNHSMNHSYTLPDSEPDGSAT